MVLMFGVSQALCACAPDSGSNAQIAQSVDHHTGTNTDHHSDDEHACDGCQHCDITDLYAVLQNDKIKATPRSETKVTIVKASTATPRLLQLRGPPAPPIDIRWRAPANTPISRQDISLT